MPLILELTIFSSITRFLVKEGVKIPNDAQRLRITKLNFLLLLSRFQVPPAFVAALCRYYQACGTGYKMDPVDMKKTSSGYWSLLPIRVQVDCSDPVNGHKDSPSGNDQMNPFHYLHLPDVGVDVRGAYVALFIRNDSSTGCTTVLVINFMDGRWSDVVEEPQTRIKEAIKARGHKDAKNDYAFVFLIFLTSAVRWWNNVLLSFYVQLAAHVREDADPLFATRLTITGATASERHGKVATSVEYCGQQGSSRDGITPPSIRI